MSHKRREVCWGVPSLNKGHGEVWGSLISSDELVMVACKSFLRVRIMGRYCFGVSLLVSLSQFTDCFKKLRKNESHCRISVSLQVKENSNGYTF